MSADSIPQEVIAAADACEELSRLSAHYDAAEQLASRAPVEFKELLGKADLSDAQELQTLLQLHAQSTFAPLQLEVIGQQLTKANRTFKPTIQTGIVLVNEACSRMARVHRPTDPHAAQEWDAAQLDLGSDRFPTKDELLWKARRAFGELARLTPAAERES